MNDPQLRLNPSPTQFLELNHLLRELTERAAGILGDNFVGAYLQGSFAVGDADIHSDCDFLIPVGGPITPDQEAGLRALHDEIPTRAGHWTQHLEGSYPNKDELRTLDGLGRPWLYIDHGWRQMQWSTHCNTEVVRWSLRECGVTLTGPDPKELVDPVGPEILRARMRKDARTFLADLLSWINFDIAWAQRYAVATLSHPAHLHRRSGDVQEGSPAVGQRPPRPAVVDPDSAGPGRPLPRLGPAGATAPRQRRTDPGVRRVRPAPNRRRAWQPITRLVVDARWQEVRLC
jgi:hypothetical protein